MSVLSDKSIYKRCVKPSIVLNGDLTHLKLNWFDRHLWAGIDRPQDEIDHIADRFGGYKPGDDYFESHNWKPMIEPFVKDQVRVDDNNRKILSYGLSSGGYDVRLGRKFKIFHEMNVDKEETAHLQHIKEGGSVIPMFHKREFTLMYVDSRNQVTWPDIDKMNIIDPLSPTTDCFFDHEGDYCLIPPGGYALGHTIETFNLPNDVIAMCVGKSSLARLGCAVNVTPIEPGFCGDVVIEIANQSMNWLKIYAGMGIAQFIFHHLDNPCMVSYTDRGGKYNGQKGITTARL